MPRRPPGRLRASGCAPIAPPDVLRRLSRGGRARLAHLERTVLWPGAAAEALRGWELFLSDPAHRIWDTDYGCGELMCCPDPAELRRIAHLVAARLPARDARLLRRHVARLDDPW